MARVKYKSFEDMQVWKDAMDLAVRVFEWSEGLPKKEDYGLTSQVRRAALSVSGLRQFIIETFELMRFDGF
jgi:hypothetical protein